ncbi:pyrimidine utilization protein D, partial [Cronobacter sakazakii]
TAPQPFHSLLYAGLASLAPAPHKETV